jgi:DNA-binding Xre family transcriptional regulator
MLLIIQNVFFYKSVTFIFSLVTKSRNNKKNYPNKEYIFMRDPLDLKPKIVAGNIRKIREHRNYTQDYLAAKLAISQNAYSKIELGYSKLTLDRLFQIAIILDVKVMDLISTDHRNTIKIDLPSGDFPLN